MPLPKNFYNIDGDEVTLEQLCSQEPAWAANRIRHLTNRVEKFICFLESLEFDNPKTFIDAPQDGIDGIKAVGDAILKAAKKGVAQQGREKWSMF